MYDNEIISQFHVDGIRDVTMASGAFLAIVFSAIALGVIRNLSGDNIVFAIFCGPSALYLWAALLFAWRSGHAEVRRDSLRWRGTFRWHEMHGADIAGIAHSEGRFRYFRPVRRIGIRTQNGDIHWITPLDVMMDASRASVRQDLEAQSSIADAIRAQYCQR